MSYGSSVTQVTDYAAVHDFFEEIATKFSSSLAIDNGARRVTYGDLQAEVTRLTYVLADQGVADAVIVGIFLSDSIGIIQSILATLKAGGVFCPLDPTFPEQRLSVMFETVAPKWCITHSRFADKLQQVVADMSTQPQLILIDELPPADNHNHRPIFHSSNPDAPCSIYFTSGSTGKPKAILGRLKGIDHFIKWEIQTVGAAPGTRVSQLAAPSFDGFLKDAFVPLCSGGVVCAPESRDVILDAWSLADWLDVEQVEILHCVPSVFRAMINQGLNSRYFEALKCVVMTGEHLYPADVKRWMDVFGERVRLFNIYGTTETSLSKIAYEVKPEDVERTSIPVGKPIKGSAIMVIDQHGQPCAVGDVGEIYIRTPFRSFGYYNEPELTKQVFIPNPFNNDPTDIVHKTGDYGRLLKSGDLEHLGRRDQQVQIRGVRVELGEIENLLRAHHAVADVAVIDRDDAEGNKFLVAYVTMANGTRSGVLRQYLAQQLPETMLPSAFVELDKLPRTLNGKIDRKALPALEVLQGQRRIEDATPRGPVEEIVAGIWCEVLKLPLVGRGDNFFNLGGHSLLVTHVIMRVRDILNVELPIRSLFESSTVAEFAELITKQISEGKQGELGQIEPVVREGELPLSYSQQRMWFYEHLAGGSASFHIPLGVRLRGELNQTAIEQTFGEIIRRHESLRTIFPAVDDRPIQVIQEPTRFDLPVVDLGLLSETQKEEVAAQLAQQEAVRRFDLAKGPLVRPTLLRMNDHDHIVICTMHHIIADGQSFEVVIAEMSQLYGALSEGRPSPLPDLSVQYVDYAAWQRQWLQGEELESRLAYWQKQLADAPERMNLPQRQTRRKVQAFRGSRQTLDLSPELVEKLKDLTRREGMTLLMTLLSAYVLLLKRYTGDDDIVVGSTYANRERPEAAKVIGILANTLVFRVNLAGAESFREVLKRVRAMCLDAYSHQLTPELLREDLATRGEDRDRLFDVWFQFEREEREKLEMPGLETEWYRVHQAEPKFELSLMLGEVKDQITGLLEYDTDLYDDETMTEMVRSYIRLLEEAVANPDGRL
ncbi:MAG: amino acid adenylation domain-containing protein [Acidobacteria bacterium]|nr:amino acid adenylation domain-containing protein [Acidobacteriota bacterium]